MKACPICHGPGERHRRVGEHWLLECLHCGFVYAGATDEEIERVNFQYSDATEHHYDEIQTGLDYLWFDRVSEWLTKGRKGLKVLDIGCGNGVLLRQFQKRGCSCFGSDPSPWARTCAERYGYTLLPCIEKADVEPGFFDVVTSTSALEHVARPLEHVQRIVEILKPGGIAYFTVPNYGSLPIRLRIVKGRLVGPPSHCNYFRVETLRNLFRHESLQGEVAEPKVRSYGIPESHGVYQWLSKRRPQRARPRPDRTSRKLRLKKALVSVYYWCGTPFGLGDKLEALIEKKADGPDGLVQRKPHE
jgi:2-polyprenyl-3-methyl-5-hydroxy-6-metoxy-1,4-benzoquinol methylase